MSYASFADEGIATAKDLHHKLDEHFCNLCKAAFASSHDLEEHLIKHSFQGEYFIVCLCVCVCCSVKSINCVVFPSE